jgi:hypothetical protein
MWVIWCHVSDCPICTPLLFPTLSKWYSCNLYLMFSTPVVAWIKLSIPKCFQDLWQCKTTSMAHEAAPITWWTMARPGSFSSCRFLKIWAQEFSRCLHNFKTLTKLIQAAQYLGSWCFWTPACKSRLLTSSLQAGSGIHIGLDHHSSPDNQGAINYKCALVIALNHQIVSQDGHWCGLQSPLPCQLDLDWLPSDC